MSNSRSSQSDDSDIDPFIPDDKFVLIENCIISLDENKAILSLNELCRTIHEDVMLIILNLLKSEDLYKLSFGNPIMGALCAKVYSQRPETLTTRLGIFSHRIREIESNIKNHYSQSPPLLCFGGLGTLVSTMAIASTDKSSHIFIGLVLTISLLVLLSGIIKAGQHLNSHFAINDMKNVLKQLNQQISENKPIPHASNIKYV